jgi:hypothetical protein
LDHKHSIALHTILFVVRGVSIVRPSISCSCLGYSKSASEVLRILLFLYHYCSLRPWLNFELQGSLEPWSIDKVSLKNHQFIFWRKVLGNLRVC